MTNKTNKVLYTGVTNDLKRRTYEHKEKLVEGFTKRYNVVKLVFFEVCEEIESAIIREKQIKGGSRKKKTLACLWTMGSRNKRKILSNLGGDKKILLE